MRTDYFMIPILSRGTYSRLSHTGVWRLFYFSAYKSKLLTLLYWYENGLFHDPDTLTRDLLKPFPHWRVEAFLFFRLQKQAFDAPK